MRVKTLGVVRRLMPISPHKLGVLTRDAKLCNFSGASNDVNQWAVASSPAWGAKLFLSERSVPGFARMSPGPAYPGPLPHRRQNEQVEEFRIDLQFHGFVPKEG